MAVSEFQVWYCLLFPVTFLQPRFIGGKQGRRDSKPHQQLICKGSAINTGQVRSSLRFLPKSFPDQMSCHFVLAKQCSRSGQITNLACTTLGHTKSFANQGLQFEKLLLSVLLMPLLMLVAQTPYPGRPAAPHPQIPILVPASLLQLCCSPQAWPLQPFPPPCPHTATTDHGQAVP